jgi:hypothetical protein
MDEQTPPTPPTDVPATPAGTPAADSVPTTAADQAVQTNDMAAFKAARQAERLGKPLALPPLSTEPPAAARDDEPPASPTTPEAARELSNRQKAINERVIDAVARATADKDAEIARLRAQVPAPREAASDPEPDANDSTKYPDGQYDRAYVKDMGLWAAREVGRQEQATRYQAEHAQRAAAQVRAQQAQFAKYAETFTAAKQADPDRIARIDARLLRLDTSASLAEGQQPTVGHRVADAVVAAADPIALLEALSDPAVETTLARAYAVSDAELYRAIGRLEGRPAATPPTKHVTSAPPPVTTLGTRAADSSDPIQTAVVNNDLSAFKAEKLRLRAAGLRR